LCHVTTLSVSYLPYLFILSSTGWHSHFFSTIAIGLQILKSLLHAKVSGFIAGEMGSIIDDPSPIAPEKSAKKQGGATEGVGGAGGGGLGRDFAAASKRDTTVDPSNPGVDGGRKPFPLALHIKTTPSAMVCDTDGNAGSRIPLGGTGALSDYIGDSRGYIKGAVPDIGDNFAKSATVVREKGTRRLRVSQCKNLRGFILGFENSWLLKYGVAVKVCTDVRTVAVVFIYLKLRVVLASHPCSALISFSPCYQWIGLIFPFDLK
jgi:hypothetical protein